MVLVTILQSVLMERFTVTADGGVVREDRLMKNAIGKNAYYFNTHSMMRRYVTEAYIH